MQPWFLATTLGASFIGSLHCAAMCGPFAALASAVGAEPASRRGTLAYHAARLVTYAGLGAVAGGLGTLVDRALTAPGTVRVAAVASALTVVALGVGSLPEVTRRLRNALPSRWSAPHPILVQIGRAPRVVRGAGLGLITPFLPCGWLYSFVALAAGTGQVLSGALLMTAFWLGSVPALAGVGALARCLTGVSRARFALLTTTVITALALAGAWTRGSADMSARTNDPAGATRHRCH